MHAWSSRLRPPWTPSEADDRSPAAAFALPPATLLARLAIFLGSYAVLAGGAWQLSAPAWNVVFAGFALLVLWELYGLVSLCSRPLRGMGLLASALLLVRPLVAPALPGTLVVSIAWLCGGALVVLGTTRPRQRELHEASLMVAGILAVTLTLGQLVAIRYLPAGDAWIALIVVTVVARESGAALGGLAFPRAPAINAAVSPRKTYAGWLVGAMASLVTALIGTRALGLALTSGQAAVFGLCLGIACQLGDLSESYLKRMVGRRHSGGILGPQGGLLDTTDALAFAAVVACGLLRAWGFGP
jgi:CDP-diglyceride synthetase